MMGLGELGSAHSRDYERRGGAGFRCDAEWASGYGLAGQPQGRAAGLQARTKKRDLLIFFSFSFSIIPNTI
jgi:hypothetical protein